jgi:hypothetical protein
MKTTIFIAFLFCAAAAFGQAGAGALSSQAVPMTIPDHPQHAQPHAMGIEHLIVGLNADTYTYAQGERPLWEFGPVSEEPSLGDVARAYRKEKLTTKKAEIYLEEQGSQKTR